MTKAKPGRGSGRWKTKNGYVFVRVPKGTPGAKQGYQGMYMQEHRWVMQQALGRPLFDKETVHHINGVRDDNRLENLELWVSSQPSGQRVEDHLAWAREIIARYGDLVEKASLNQAVKPPGASSRRKAA